MSNSIRKRSEHIYELSAGQLKAFLEIAVKQDRPLEEVVLGALDEYIKREKESCLRND